MIVDGVDLGIVGTAQLVLKLEVVGWIGEDEIGAAFRQRPHFFHAIAFDHPIERVFQFELRHVPPDLSTMGGDSDSYESTGQESYESKTCA